jgi:D-alanyl-D-alanine carboxypeptidase/D-alanyl-D-alanine-endopeptidase (penicillin-binding protein 4)
LPPAALATLRASGLPLTSFGLAVRRVDTEAPADFVSLNANQPFLLASTAKIVTSLAALDLLGPAHHWRLHARATGPVTQGRLNGDLVIVGDDAGLTLAELKRWFQRMHAEGVTEVDGRIVLDRVTLLHEAQARQAKTTAEESAAGPAAVPDARTYNRAAMVVAVQPSAGPRATVTLMPRPAGINVINEVSMRGGPAHGRSSAVADGAGDGDAGSAKPTAREAQGCSAYARWQIVQNASTPALVVSGLWHAGCGRQEIGFMRPPPRLQSAGARLGSVAPVPAVSINAPQLVGSLWSESGGRVRGGVVEASRARMSLARVSDTRAWRSDLTTPIPQLVREINKTSNNVGAHQLLLSLAASGTPRPSATLAAAQGRVAQWLRAQGIADGDVRIEQGSGQSRNERGKPAAMVQLLRNAWHARHAKVFVDSLPVAGVDGTLAGRMRSGAAAGNAFLKTGTLSDTRALAGYVRAKSGKVYAVAVLVNHPKATLATPALDAFIEWVARNG